MKLEVRNVTVSFRKEHQTKLFGGERQMVLQEVSMDIDSGESVALVGESGSGKSTLGRVVSGLLLPDSGAVAVDGVLLYGKRTKAERKRLRHNISIVFQDYTSSVNPRFRVCDILRESLIISTSLTKSQLFREIAALLELVGLDETFMFRYPHELSGGQLQRVCIARAVAIKPQLIVLDEAVSSLDASTQTQVMDLLINLQDRYGFSYLVITHDLTAVTYMCSRVLFFNQGKIVEVVDSIKKLPEIRHPYAKKLFDSVIGIDPQMMYV